MPEEKPSDFRYETGPSKVPWAAVGENYNSEDIVDVVKFLIQKADEKDTKYDEILQDIKVKIQHGP